MCDIIYYNGPIFSFHSDVQAFEAVGIKDGKIKIAGGLDEVLEHQEEHTQLFDLQGKTLLPGFIDAHIHVWKVGNLMTYLLDLRGVGSIGEIQERLKKFREENPEATWISARGFNEISMLEKRLPTREDLDEVFTDIPVVLQRTCAHISVVNTKALEISDLGIGSRNPIGGEIDRGPDGMPNGILRETAQGLVYASLPHYTDAQYCKMIQAAQDALLAQGITSATDPAVAPDLFDIYKKMAEDGLLKIRIRAFPILLPDGGSHPLPLPERYESDYFKANIVKFFSDGGLSGRTAALSRPYLDEKTGKPSKETGISRLEEQHFFQLASNAVDHGWGIATHAIGDKAIGLVLSVYKKLRKKSENAILRIEHLGLPTYEHLLDIRSNGIGVATQPIFLEELGPNFVRYLDAHFLDQCYPVRSLIYRGIKTAFSSDAPVVKNFNPLKGVSCAVLRKTATQITIAPHESVSIAEGLRAFTVGAAELNGDAGFLGRIAPGYAADFVILDKNPLETPPELLDQIKVLQTIVGGKPTLFS